MIDIKDASTKDGALLDVFPYKVGADGYSGSDNHQWYFVTDFIPGTDGKTLPFSRIASKLNGNVIDIQNALAPPAKPPLDSFPPKLTDATNQQWQVVDGAFPSITPTALEGLSWGQGNVNYFFNSAPPGENVANPAYALTKVSATIEFHDALVSSSNGYGFQLNCASCDGYTTTWQQYVIYAESGDNSLTAQVANWSGTDAERPPPEPIQWTTQLAPLPSTPMIPAGYKITIALNFRLTEGQPLVSGATYTVVDNTGTTIGNVSIDLLSLSNSLTGQQITIANLAPIGSFQILIVGGDQSPPATFTSGAGAITYTSSGCRAVPTRQGFPILGFRSEQHRDGRKFECDLLPTPMAMEHFDG